MADKPRKFARGTGGTARVTRLPSCPPRLLASTCREAEVLRVLAEQSLLVSEDWTPHPDLVSSLVETAFGRRLDRDEVRLVEALDERTRAVADAIWVFFCQPDDAPTACGIPDPRFTHYWTRDEPRECPLVGCCKSCADGARSQ